MSSKVVLLMVLIACVCTAVIAVHCPVLWAQALFFDDGQYLVNNTLVKNPGWSSAWKFLSEVLEPSTVGGYYQPLAMISLMFDYSFGGRVENLMPFHRTSLIFHTANTALIILLLYLLFDQVWIAAAVGLLFGLHPMTVETIPWVGERKTLLAAFFVLWSLIFYLRHARSLGYCNQKSKIQNLKSKNLWFCFLFYFLALMSKPTSTPLPLLLLLLDFWPLGRLKWSAVLEKIPFFILGGISAIITYISQTRTAASILPMEVGIWHIPLVLCHNIIFYIYKIILPINLSSHYPFPDPMNLSQPMVLAGVIGTCILIPLLLISLRWTRAAFTGWLFFFAAILPTMQIIGFTNVIASDKYVYLPSFGLLMILTFFLSKFNIHNLSPQKQGHKIIIIILVLSVASAESFATRSYLVHWRNSFGLCEYMSSKAPNAPLLHNYRGTIYFELGRYEEAIEYYKQSIRVQPGYAYVYRNLGIAYDKLDRYEEAIEAYKQAIRIKSNYAEAQYYLGNTYNKLGRYREAIESYEQAIKISPNFAEAQYNLGNAYDKFSRWQDAIKSYKQAIKTKPNYAEAYCNLGADYSELGYYQDAMESYKQAIRINPNNAKLYNNLSNAYNKLGRYQEAIESSKQAIRIKPDFAEAHYNLGNAYDNLGHNQDAVDAYKQAIKIKPNLVDARYNLSIVYLATGDKDSAIEEYKVLKIFDAELANKLSALINK